MPPEESLFAGSDFGAAHPQPLPQEPVEALPLSAFFELLELLLEEEPPFEDPP